MRVLGAHHAYEEARFTIRTSAPLTKVADLLADIPMKDREIALMVEMTASTPRRVIIHSTCGTYDCWSRPVNIFATTIRDCFRTRRHEITSARKCFMASTSMAPCCGSAP